MSSTASTSATIIKRSEPSKPNGSSTTNGHHKAQMCQCCPHGFHIDLGFVQFAQDVSNGFISRQGTPTHFKSVNERDRQLMSPMESNFSDSLENIFSDFADALAPHKAADREQMKTNRETDIQNLKNRLQNGYSSDYTVYRRGVSYAPEKSSPIRPNQLSFSGSRSGTPVLNGGSSIRHTNGSTPTYKTSLAKTAAELRARNVESPFPDLTSRVNTPIDLGLNQSPHYFNNNGNRCVTPTRFYNQHHDQLPPTPSPMLGRRAPSQGDLPDLSRTTAFEQNGSGNGGDFASLRRGRQFALPDVAPSPRVRFLSASPKMPRRLAFTTAAAPPTFGSLDRDDPPAVSRQIPAPVTPSTFTYTHQRNGEVVLARNQATLTSPQPSSAFVPIEKPVVTRSIATTTGPLPPAKPCVECPTLRKELQIAIEKIPPPAPSVTTIGTSTEAIKIEHKSVGDPICIQHVGVGTDILENVKVEASMMTDCLDTPQLHVEIQTDEQMFEKPEMVETASSPIMFDADIRVPTPEHPSAPQECKECEKRQNTFTRNVGIGACTVSDRICVNCDGHIDETDENEAPGFQVDQIESNNRQKEFEVAKSNAVKKLLTNEQKSNFHRGTAVSKSARYDRKKTVDNLDYIIDKNKKPSAPSSTTTTPSVESTDALKSKVILKKDAPINPVASVTVVTAPTPPQSPPTQLLEPIAARIPRPKISKWATPEEAAETPDEEEEAQDRLTPLRSELRPLGNRWLRNSANNAPLPPSNLQQLPYSSTNSDDISDSDAESDCSANSDGTFDVMDDILDATPFEMSDKLREAIENLNSSLLEAGSVPDETVDLSRKLVQHEWMKTAARKTSKYDHVDKFIEELKNLGPKIVHEVVNLSDQNGNTALHYVVSHANFSVVSSILDSGECELNKANMAGYTPVMLAALSSLEDDMEQAVVQRLFEMGDVNARATPHGQTALMLAVSHGKRLTTELLLQCEADVNLQDEEGSTALMCAAEHGHRDIVKLLLSQPTIDTNLTDCDSSTALTIAIENGHREIGVLIYAHQNYAQLDTFGPTTDI